MNTDDFEPLHEKTKGLPREIPAARDLWPDIHARITDTSAPVVNFAAKKRRVWITRLSLAAAAVVVLATSIFVFRRDDGVKWSVSSLAGSPRVDSRTITGDGQWQRGQWLETDATSRASLAIGTIGEVRLEPGSRVRLLGTDATNHRLELKRGTMHALIWAPPRLFFVETPSATAVDLGCAYSLTVDDAGAGTLHVTSGYVALEHQGRESLVPAGWLCLTRPGIGPGTPFAENASAELRSALERFDFVRGQSETVAPIVALCMPGDAITLWHLLSRVSSAQRTAVFEKLAAFQSPPTGVTRDGILRGDKTMLALWATDLGFSPALGGK